MKILTKLFVLLQLAALLPWMIIQDTHSNKGMLTIFKWPKHLIVLNFVNSGITINKMAKVFITLIS